MITRKKVVCLVLSSLLVIGLTHTLYSTQVHQASPSENHYSTSLTLDIAKRSKKDCKDKICSQYLTEAELPYFNYCVKKTWKTDKHPEPEASKCRFMDGDGRNPVALASYPGSGNTWVRGLLQEVTGLCTGGVYCDTNLRQNGFPGERIGSGIVLAVKTHQPDPRWSGVYYNRDLPLTYYHKVEEIPIFGAAILLTRNPFDAIVSEYNRQVNENSPNHHTLQRKPEDFGGNEKWHKFVLAEATKWQSLTLAFLLDNHRHPVLVVRYEDLQVDVKPELRRMLNFLHVPYEEAMLRRVSRVDYTKYKRSKQQVAYYTSEQVNYVRNTIQETVERLTEHVPDQAGLFAEYLSSNVPTVEYDDLSMINVFL